MLTLRPLPPRLLNCQVFHAHRESLVLLSRLVNVLMLGALIARSAIPEFLLRATCSRYVRCVVVLFKNAYRPLLVRHVLLICALDAMGLTWVANSMGPGLRNPRLEAVLMWVIGVAVSCVLDGSQRRSFLRAHRRAQARKAQPDAQLKPKAQLSFGESVTGGCSVACEHEDELRRNISDQLPGAGAGVGEGGQSMQRLLRWRARCFSTASAQSCGSAGGSGGSAETGTTDQQPSVSGWVPTAPLHATVDEQSSGDLQQASALSNGAGLAQNHTSSPGAASLYHASSSIGSGKPPSSNGQAGLSSAQNKCLPVTGLQCLACVLRGFPHPPTEALFTQHMRACAWRVDAAAALALGAIAAWSSDWLLTVSCAALCLLRLALLSVAAPLALHASGVIPLVIAAGTAALQQARCNMGPREAMVHLLVHGFIVPATLHVRFCVFAAVSILVWGGTWLACSSAAVAGGCSQQEQHTAQMSTLLSLLVAWACDYSARVQFVRDAVKAPVPA